MVWVDCVPSQFIHTTSKYSIPPLLSPGLQPAVPFPYCVNIPYSVASPSIVIWERAAFHTTGCNEDS